MNHTTTNNRGNGPLHRLSTFTRERGKAWTAVHTERASRAFVNDYTLTRVRDDTYYGWVVSGTRCRHSRNTRCDTTKGQR